jgi:hypothetical protein
MNPWLKIIGTGVILIAGAAAFFLIAAWQERVEKRKAKSIDYSKDVRQ